MACNYKAIRKDNERRYGTDIGRIGPMLLANRYADRTHFIYELLQNTEDALARRPGWKGSRSVDFLLMEDSLRVSHSGKLFDEEDVRGICGIGESTKDLTDIGRFGIGFKSVYAFTDRPEVHSGNENFAIESFVWPIEVPVLKSGEDETVIVIPLRGADGADKEEIATGLQRLGAGTLLFLRQIDEISWSVRGGPSGLYLRDSKEIDTGVRRITVIGQEEGENEIEETWLVFSRAVATDGRVEVGYAEIAFSIVKDDKAGREIIKPVERSPLVVFFPTVLETYLGFLVQGPYRTTPSRDNVPRNNTWNQSLVRETASLLVEALPWLRDANLLDAEGLQCLPLDPDKFDEGTMFAPLFRVTKDALSSESLLPRFGKGYVAGTNARLARTQELRELFSPSQLSMLYSHKDELFWLSDEITQDRTPVLRQYLMGELGITEVTPESILPKLDKQFLEAQSDAWIVKLYEFLNGQTALRFRLYNLPLIRLEDGTHLVARLNGQPQAFLPGSIKTGFPTVRTTVCATDLAREFLRSLGLTEPDPVDDVVRNVLPKYQKDEVAVGDAEYETDIGRMLSAFATDSKGQREKLVEALRNAAFVRAVNSGNLRKCFSKPGEVYLATERLKELFGGVDGVFLVDDSYPCLRGEDVRELLEACGVTRYLRPVSVTPDFTWQQLREMRVAAGCENITYAGSLEDHTLNGLDAVLRQLPSLAPDTRKKRAALLWEALDDLQDRRGTGIFSGSYRWTYYYQRSTTFETAFVRQLNGSAWVPGANGQLESPEFVVFDTLGWKENPFLQSKIRFKPPVIEQLAHAAGIEPGVLDLLKKLGVTSEAELRDRLGMKDELVPKEDLSPVSPEEAIKKLLSETPTPTPPVQTALDPNPPGHGGVGGGSGDRQSAGGGGSKKAGDGKRTRESAGSRKFVSYVAAHSQDEEPDPDGLDQSARMVLEAKAIDLILAHEPQWQRTATHNPGFDLFEPGADGKPTCWVEVKAMTGSLHDRPVGLSRTQFEHAQKDGEAYWLYVVEHAGTDRARIVRIQDPAGKARTFTFDHGWLRVAKADADTDTKQEDLED